MSALRFQDSLLVEWDREMRATRRLVERAPLDRYSWRPSESARTLGDLVTHVIDILSWVPRIMSRDRGDVTDDREGVGADATTSSALARFDTAVTDARAAIANRTELELLTTWTLERQGQIVFTAPRITVLRTFVFNHVIHHRGQLTVYFRSCAVPLPSIYGPSGDEPGV
ncbi:MAG: DinB family protein [Vicinamibacterales bacterium]